MLPLCTCSNHSNNVAIVNPVFLWGTPEQWQIDFVKANCGKLVCYDCGGEVMKEYAPNYDHVSGDTVTERLRELGVI